MEPKTKKHCQWCLLCTKGHKCEHAIPVRQRIESFKYGIDYEAFDEKPDCFEALWEGNE